MTCLEEREEVFDANYEVLLEKYGPDLDRLLYEACALLDLYVDKDYYDKYEVISIYLWGESLSMAERMSVHYNEMLTFIDYMCQEYDCAVQGNCPFVLYYILGDLYPEWFGDIYAYYSWSDFCYLTREACVILRDLYALTVEYHCSSGGSGHTIIVGY